MKQWGLTIGPNGSLLPPSLKELKGLGMLIDPRSGNLTSLWGAESTFFDSPLLIVCVQVKIKTSVTI
jgi:hypothetical protein